MTNNTKDWKPCGWPWELELLAFFFVVMAVGISFYLQAVDPEHAAHELSFFEQQAASSKAGSLWLEEQTNLFWAMGLIGLYVVHLLVAASSMEWVSASIMHLFAPTFFGMISYFRLLELNKTASDGHAIVSGAHSEMILWLLAIAVATLLLARLLMGRVRRQLKNEQWLFVGKNKLDGTFWSLLAQLRPLLYMPHVYKVSNRGISIEGFIYFHLIPMELIENVEACRMVDQLTEGICYATSTRNLVRIHIAEKPSRIHISPENREGFLSACRQAIEAWNKDSSD